MSCNCFPVILSLALCIRSAVPAEAQIPSEKFLKPANWNPNTLVGEQSMRFAKLDAMECNAALFPYEVANLSLVQSNGRIKIELPVSSCGEVIYRAVNVQYYSEQNYEWTGRVESNDSCGCFDGHLTLISNENGKFGHLAVADKSYELHDLGGGKNVLVKNQPLTGGPFECLPSSSMPAPVEISIAEERENNNCDVRLLVLYDQAALDVEGSIQAVKNRAALGVSQINYALSNSMFIICALR